MQKENPTPPEIAALRGATTAVVLGSGLGEVSSIFPTRASCPFDVVPGLGQAVVAGHRGELVLAGVGDFPCLFVRGRRHYYEGEGSAIDHLIQCLAWLGIRDLVLTSAAGSLVRHLAPGDLVLADHILDLQFRPPRAVTDGVAERHPMARLDLDNGLRKRLRQAAGAAGVALIRGHMACLAGPNYETHAEVVALQRVGISVVTMSVAAEVQSANAVGIRVASMALVTNWTTGLAGDRLSHDEVLDRGRDAVAPLARVVRTLLVGGARER